MELPRGHCRDQKVKKQTHEQRSENKQGAQDYHHCFLSTHSRFLPTPPHAPRSPAMHASNSRRLGLIRRGGGQMGRDGLGGLEAVAGDAKHDRFVGRQLARSRSAFSRTPHGDAAGGLGEDAFGFREQPDAGHDLRVAHVLARAAGGLDLGARRSSPSAGVPMASGLWRSSAASARAG